MKITFVTPSMNSGGAERVMSLLANFWISQGIDVDFIILNDDHSVFYKLNDGINVYFMQEPIFNSIGNFRSIVKNLSKLMKKSKPDVVISFFSGVACLSGLVLRGKKIPLIYSERNDPNNNIKGFKNKFWQFLSLRFAKRVIFQTAGAMNYYGKGTGKKSTIILNPFEKTNIPLPPAERTKTLVSVGRLCEQKNQEMQLRVFKRIHEKYPEYKLEIYGKGPLKEALEAQIKEYGLEDSVILKGACNDVLERINNAEIFLFTSWFEGLPNAVIEAMALGLPCVCTKCSPGGAEALIENHVNGVLVDFDDEQMVNEIVALIESPKERERISAEARKIVERLDVHTIAGEWNKVIEEIV